MLDNLRDSANKSPFFQEEQSPPEEPETPKKSENIFLGMTPVQRFILAVLIFMMTCVGGMFCLLITEKIVLPF
jgi:hypothetical protein